MSDSSEKCQAHAPRIYLSRYPELSGKEGRRTEHETGLFLLTAALREWTGADYTPEELSSLLGQKEKGKPVLVSSGPSSGLFFNISHSHGLAVCAAGDSEVGADVEKVRPVRDALIRRVLSPAEYSRFMKDFPAAGGAEKSFLPAAELFFRFWTLKEAYGKQRGTGISYPLQETDFVLPASFPPAGQCLEISSPQPGLFFYQWLLAGDYVLSLCCGKHFSPGDIQLRAFQTRE